MGLPLPKPAMDRADFLAWEGSPRVKHEFVAGEVFAMVGARQDHVVVAGALFARLRERLRGTRCRAYTADMQLEVQAADAVFHRDVMVSRDEDDRKRPLAVQSPCLVVEVLSEGTAACDRGPRFAAYRLLPRCRSTCWSTSSDAAARCSGATAPAGSWPSRLASRRCCSCTASTWR